MSLSNHQNNVRVANLNKQISVKTEKLQALPEPECIHDDIEGSEQIQKHHRLKRDHKIKLQNYHIHIAQIKSETRKKKQEKERVKRLNAVQKKIILLQREADQSLCEGCQHLQTCTDRYHTIRAEEKRLQKLKKRTTYIEDDPRQQIAARLKVLEELGYTEAQALLPRGNTAAHLYGYEVQLTQLLFGGFFEKLTEDEINCLMVTIVTEPRKGVYFKPLNDESLLEILHAVNSEISFIQYLEGKHKVTEITPMLELRLCTAMLAWSRGCEFDQLEKYAHLDAGDFVRTFRLVIDQLRQIRRTMTGHAVLLDKLSRCIGKINRDVIDAERQLRIGQENPDEMAAEDGVNGDASPATAQENADNAEAEEAVLLSS